MNPIPRSMIIAIVILVLLIIVGGAYWYWRSLSVSPSAPSTTANQQNAPAPAAQGLGSEVYGKIADPVSGNIPAPVAPVSNPIQNAYKNPFQ